MKKLLPLLLFLVPSFLGRSQLLPITDICVVTVDTSFTHNVIVWEENAQIGEIDSILIFSEDPSTGSWLEIGRVDYDSLSEFHDYSANPNLRSYAYRIAGMDDHGTIGLMSTPHATIHVAAISINSNDIDLIWSPYIGVPSSIFNSYLCWSDSLSLSSWNLEFSTTLGNLNDTNWTDASAPSDWSTLNYKIDTDWGHNCTSTRGNNHNTSRSNKTQPSAPQYMDEQIQEFYVFPNPANQILNFAFSTTSYSTVRYQLINQLGQIIISKTNIKLLGQYRDSINLSSIPEGIYFLCVESDFGPTKAIKVKIN